MLYQALSGAQRFTKATKLNITGTSTKTPTTVAKAAPELSPKREMATATASSKKLEVPIKQAGPAT
jgi:hypothetical protein